MNTRTMLTGAAVALTLATSPVLAEELNRKPADYTHNVAQDAEQCVYTAEAIGYDHALSTDACQRFMDRAMKAYDMMSQEYYDHLKEHKPSLLIRLNNDIETIKKAGGRMKYLSQQ